MHFIDNLTWRTVTSCFPISRPITGGWGGWEWNESSFFLRDAQEEVKGRSDVCFAYVGALCPATRHIPASFRLLQSAGWKEKQIEGTRQTHNCRHLLLSRRQEVFKKIYNTNKSQDRLRQREGKIQDKYQVNCIQLRPFRLYPGKKQESCQKMVIFVLLTFTGEYVYCLLF